MSLDTGATASAAPVAAADAVGKKRLGMVIDLDRCVGCWTCAVACKSNNNVGEGLWWNRILTVGGSDLDVPVGEYPNLSLAYQPSNCFHCDNPPCVKVCPVGATFQREDGIVMMDYDRCIGCRYCEMACPTGSRSFNWEAFTDKNPAVPQWGQPEIARRPRGVVEKCSFCYQRIDRGLALGLTPGIDQAASPACVVACPTGARLFGDLNDPDSPVSRALDENPSFRLREALGTEPRVYYLPRRGRKQENIEVNCS